MHTGESEDEAEVPGGEGEKVIEDNVKDGVPGTTVRVSSVSQASLSLSKHEQDVAAKQQQGITGVSPSP